MMQEASKPEDFRAIADDQEAEQTAEKGDGPKTLEHLKAAGEIVLDVAEKVGSAVAIESSQAAWGL